MDIAKTQGIMKLKTCTCVELILGVKEGASLLQRIPCDFYQGRAKEPFSSGLSHTKEGCHNLLLCARLPLESTGVRGAFFKRRLWSVSHI